MAGSPLYLRPGMRWSRLSVRERLLILVQKGCVELGMTFLDGTNIRTHQKAAGAPGKTTRPHNAMRAKRWADLWAASALLDGTCNVVDALGQMHGKPWGERRTCRYGAPLGVKQLFADGPPVGLS